MSELKLTAILEELKEQKTSPLAIHTNSTITYIVFPIKSYGINGELSGYSIQRVTAPTNSHTYIDFGFLPESLRVSGANGSAANVNLKTDSANTLLLITDASIVYG